MAADANRRGTEFSPDQLSPEALRSLIEEFVTRDGTDYGAVERSVEEKIAQVRALAFPPGKCQTPTPSGSSPPARPGEEP